MPRFAGGLVCWIFLASCATAPVIPPAALIDLAPTGKLRAAINYGNGVLATRVPATGEPRDKLKAPEGQPRSISGESVQHAQLKIMEGSQVKLKNAQYVDTTNILFICGGALVGLDSIMAKTQGYGYISTSNDDDRNILNRLNARVKPTDLFEFGLIPEFTGRLPIVASFQNLSRQMLVRIMTEPKNSIYNQFREIFKNEGLELSIDQKVFEQISEIAIEYRTGARSLRGILEEMITPILFALPDRPEVGKVVIASLFTEPSYVNKAEPA